MDLYTCAINTIKLNYKLAVSTARERKEKGLFMHILTVFGLLNPMGFIPKFCLVKTLCSVGNWRNRR